MVPADPTTSTSVRNGATKLASTRASTLPGNRSTAATLTSTWVGPMTALAWTASGSAPTMARA